MPGMVVRIRPDPRAARDIASAARWIHACGWAPATSGNYSLRTADGIAITTSGRDKSLLTPDQVMLVDGAGNALGEGQPSAETLLHCRLYRRDPGIGAVLHTHSVAATVLSRRIGAGGRVVLEGYELAKAFPGIRDHRTPLVVPVLANRQDMAVLAGEVDAALDADPDARAYLLAGHGTYTWAADLATAQLQLEALEFLFTCALHG